MEALNFTLPAQILRKASLHQSTEEIRMYICGVHVTPKHVVATDGRTCYICELDECQTEHLKMALFVWSGGNAGVTFQINGKIPLRATSADIYFPRTQTNGIWAPGTLSTHGPTKSATKTFTTNYRDGAFPTWENIVPKMAPGEVDRFSFGGNLLKRIADTYQDFAMFHRPDDSRPELAAWTVTDNGSKPDADKIVVMPSRID